MSSPKLKSTSRSKSLLKSSSKSKSSIMKSAVVNKILSKSISKKNNQHYHEDICCEVTFCGLNHWYKEEFEKLGWMVLADSKGMKDKTTMYKTSLTRLKDALEHKLTHSLDKDKIQDIHIMLHNVNILIDHVNKDFN
jgi:hypothetical protein